MSSITTSHIVLFHLPSKLSHSLSLSRAHPSLTDKANINIKKYTSIEYSCMNAHKENSLHFLCPKQNIKMQVWVQNLIGEGASLINKRRQKGLITAGSWQEGERGIALTKLLNT